MNESEYRRVFRLPREARRQVEQELDDELRFHLDRRIERLVAGGMEPDEAREKAIEGFGDVAEVRDYCFRQ